MVIRRSGAGLPSGEMRYFVQVNDFPVGSRSPRRARQELWEARKEARDAWVQSRGRTVFKIYAVQMGIIIRVDQWLPSEEDLVDVVEATLAESGRLVAPGETVEFDAEDGPATFTPTGVGPVRVKMHLGRKK